MNEDIRNKTHYQETFSQLHAPQALAGKVMNMNNTRKNTHPLRLKKLTAAAAVFALLLVGSTGIWAAANSTGGIFKDIFRWDGAVVGTEYAEATEELAMQVAVTAPNTLTLEVSMAAPDAVPWRELEAFSLRSFRLLDADGAEIPAAAEDVTPISGGAALLSLTVSDPLIPGDTYTLEIEALQGHSKADAPLEITGQWRCSFTAAA